jgi:hypothetical protein
VSAARPCCMARADTARWENARVAFNDELMTLVNEVADRVDLWTGHEAWTFEPGSSASAEVANKEMRLDGSPWGSSGGTGSCRAHQLDSTAKGRCP